MITLTNNELVTTEREYRREGNAYWIVTRYKVIKVWEGNIVSWTLKDREYFTNDYNHALKCEVAGEKEVLNFLQTQIEPFTNLLKD